MSSEPKVSLQNILNLIEQENEATSLQLASTVRTLLTNDVTTPEEVVSAVPPASVSPPGVTVKHAGQPVLRTPATRPSSRPTQPTPVRTSTYSPYSQTNFVDNQRSTVAVDLSQVSGIFSPALSGCNIFDTLICMIMHHHYPLVLLVSELSFLKTF